MRFYILHRFGFVAKAVRRPCAFLSVTGPWNDEEWEVAESNPANKESTPPRWWRLNLPLLLKKKRNSLCSLICSTWELETSGWLGGDCKTEWGERKQKVED